MLDQADAVVCMTVHPKGVPEEKEVIAWATQHRLDTRKREWTTENGRSILRIPKEREDPLPFIPASNSLGPTSSERRPAASTMPSLIRKALSGSLCRISGLLRGQSD